MNAQNIANEAYDVVPQYASSSSLVVTIADCTHRLHCHQAAADRDSCFVRVSTVNGALGPANHPQAPSRLRRNQYAEHRLHVPAVWVLPRRTHR